MNSALGKELVRSITEDLYANLLRDAQAQTTADTAFGLLKEASGVIKVVDHLRFLSVNIDEAKRD